MTLKEFFSKIASRTLWGNCLGMIVLGVVLIFGANFLINLYTRHNVEVEVPNLRGKSAAAAIALLDELGLEAEVTDTGYVKALPPDAILEQSVAAGHKVKPGRIVRLTVNAAGPRAIALPDISDNCSLREAEAKLKAIGFTIGKIERVQGDLDWVYAVKVNGKTVAAGSRVSIETPITLVVGDGLIEEEFNGNDSLDYELFGTPSVDTLDSYVPAQPVSKGNEFE